MLYMAVGACPCLAIEPAPIELKGAALVPTMSAQQMYYDNLLRQPEDTRSTFATVFNPALDLQLERSRLAFSSRVAVESGRYWQSSDDNYDDISLGAESTWQFNSRNQFNLASQLARGHEQRGTAFSAGAATLNINRPDTYNDKSLSGRYRFGAPSARGRLIFTLGRSEREYRTRREFTRIRDKKVHHFSTAFFSSIGGKTSGVVEFKAIDTNYSSRDAFGLGTLDSKGRRLLMGITWQATGKTEGDVRFGFADKNFSSRQRENFSGFSWRASAKWLPRSYSSFSLQTARQPIETDGAGDFIDEQMWRLGWQHKWLQRVSSHVTTSLIDRNYQGNFNARNETTQSVSVGVDYSVKRWLDVGFSLAHEDKSSNLAAFEYNSNLAVLDVKLSL